MSGTHRAVQPEKQLVSRADTREAVPLRSPSGGGVMAGLLQHIERAERVECWLPIPGYEGYYEASDLGRIRSLDRIIVGGGCCPRRRKKGQILRGRPNNHGYPSVYLSKDGHRRNITVHSLILLTFRGPRPEGRIIRHLNGDQLDARLENLVYGTFSENNLDTLRHGRNPFSNKTECDYGHPLAGDNLYVNKLGHHSCLSCRRDAHKRLVERRKAARRARAGVGS